MQRTAKQLKLAKWTKNEQTTNMRYFKIPLCPKFVWCEKTEMPLGQKRLRLTQTQIKMIFVQSLIYDSCKQTEKTQGQIAGTENGFLCRKWPKYPFVWFYAKNSKDWSSNVRSWSTVVNCRAIQNWKSIRNIKEIQTSIFRSKMRVWHHRYYILFLDDFTNFLWTFPITNKSKAQTNNSIFLKFRNHIKIQFERYIKCFQCDNGKEFDNSSFHKFCEQTGMSFRFSCPHTSPQNGKTEREIRTINNITRTLLAHASLPPIFLASRTSNGYLFVKYPS